MERNLTPPPDTSPAEWITTALTNFGESVLSVVPSGFQAYLRVFHPAYRRPQPSEPPTLPVSWAEIAKTHGKVAHAGMQLNALTGRELFDNDPPPPDFDGWPVNGSFPSELAGSLVAALRAHTSTPERCWFAIWAGWGDLRDDDLVRRSPQFNLPSREYHLLEGPIESFVAGMAPSRKFPYGYRSPSIFWPDDHAWCVACEVDFTTTYIGCSETCRSDILATQELETFPIDPATGLGYASDTLNPLD